MATISIEDLRRDPDAWLDRVVATGEQIVVSQAGRPVAVIGPVNPPTPARRQTPRPIGLAAGAFVVPDDFDAPLPDDVLDAFEH